MADVLIVKNITREGPGLLEAVLKAEGLTFDLVDLTKTTVFPSPFDYQALVVLGGPDSANDDTQKMQNELSHIQSALEGGLPYLGICLGMQALVKAAGGQVVKSPVKEVGFTAADGKPQTVELTELGKSDPLLKGIAASPKVFHLHGETVELAPGMELLAIGRDCKNQIIKVGNTAYGIQSHFELTPEMLAVWAKEDPDLTPIGVKKLAASFKKVQKEYTKTGETIFRNFLAIAGLK